MSTNTEDITSALPTHLSRAADVPAGSHESKLDEKGSRSIDDEKTVNPGSEESSLAEKGKAQKEKPVEVAASPVVPPVSFFQLFRFVDSALVYICV